MIEYTTEETINSNWENRRHVEKKILSEYFDGLINQYKTYELRKDDDGIKPGDILVLKEWDGKKYTGRKVEREVVSVLKDCPAFGLMEGYCIISIRPKL